MEVARGPGKDGTAPEDSDGNMNPVIDAILACGVTCLYPCEPAGMDMMELRKKEVRRRSWALKAALTNLYCAAISAIRAELG